MKNVVIIPARYDSTRFPGKPLELLRGRDGQKRPLIEHTWNAARTVRAADAVYVATDNELIAATVRKFGGQVLMTSSDCKNGTERCAEALEQLPSSVEIICNLQGDAPLTPGYFVDELISSLEKQLDLDAATPVLLCDAVAKKRLLDDRSNGRVGGTTAVFDHNNHALYFSKEVTPYGLGDVYHHVGVYAYRPKTLKQYLQWEDTNLEKSEGLEQLRFLENGAKLLCVEVVSKDQEFWEVNNPEDISLVESLMESKNEHK